MDLQLVIQETPDRVLSDVEYVHDFVKEPHDITTANTQVQSGRKGAFIPSSQCVRLPRAQVKGERDKNVEQV